MQKNINSQTALQHYIQIQQELNLVYKNLNHCMHCGQAMPGVKDTNVAVTAVLKQHGFDLTWIVSQSQEQLRLREDGNIVPSNCFMIPELLEIIAEALEPK